MEMVLEGAMVLVHIVVDVVADMEVDKFTSMVVKIPNEECHSIVLLGDEVRDGELDSAL